MRTREYGGFSRKFLRQYLFLRRFSQNFLFSRHISENLYKIGENVRGSLEIFFAKLEFQNRRNFAFLRKDRRHFPSTLGLTNKKQDNFDQIDADNLVKWIGVCINRKKLKKNFLMKELLNTLATLIYAFRSIHVCHRKYNESRDQVPLY